MSEHIELFPYPANWRQPVVESFEFQTEVVTSQSGKEQRRAMRRNARFYQEYSIAATGPSALQLKRQLNFWGAYLFSVPNWARRAEVAAGAGAGVSAIPVTYPIPGLRTGHKIMIESATGGVTTRTVVEQYMDRIEIDSPLIYAVPAGSLVYLLLDGYLPQGQQSIALTDAAAQMSVRFEALPETIYFASASPAMPQHDGLEVVELKPNWQNGLETTHAYETYDVDFGRGRMVRYHPIDYTRPLVRWQMRSLNRDRSNAVIALFHRLKGRLKPCYVPSQLNDLPVTKVSKGDTHLLVQGKDAYLYWDRTVDRAIRIETVTGDVWYNRVTAITETEDGSDVKLATSIPAKADIRAVSWMRRCRLSSDLLVVSWRSDTISECDLTFSTLEDSA